MSDQDNQATPLPLETKTPSSDQDELLKRIRTLCELIDNHIEVLAAFNRTQNAFEKIQFALSARKTLQSRSQQTRKEAQRRSPMEIRTNKTMKQKKKNRKRGGEDGAIIWEGSSSEPDLNISSLSRKTLTRGKSDISATSFRSESTEPTVVSSKRASTENAMNKSARDMPSFSALEIMLDLKNELEQIYENVDCSDSDTEDEKVEIIEEEDNLPEEVCTEDDVFEANSPIHVSNTKTFSPLGDTRTEPKRTKYYLRALPIGQE